MTSKPDENLSPMSQLLTALNADADFATLTALAGNDPIDALSINWRIYRQLPTVEINSAVAMSVGLEPRFANQNWALLYIQFVKQVFSKSPDHMAIASKLFDFVERIIVAQNNLLPHGKLRYVRQEPYLHETRVRFADFVEWALERQWTLPSEFESLVTGSNQEVSDRKGKGLSKTIGALTHLLVSKSKLYSKGIDQPNVARIACDSFNLLQTWPEAERPKISETTLREHVSAGLHALRE